jgi:hypothetical protein
MNKAIAGLVGSTLAAALFATLAPSIAAAQGGRGQAPAAKPGPIRRMADGKPNRRVCMEQIPAGPTMA